jgi:hypothetical protein
MLVDLVCGLQRRGMVIDPVPKVIKIPIPMDYRTRCVKGVMVSLLLLCRVHVSAQSFQPLAGCDCPTVSLTDAYRAADLVFEGTPLGADTVLNKGETGEYKKNSVDHVSTRFSVDRMWKGPGGGSAEVATFYKRDQCAYRFNPGMHYLVFAHSAGGMMVTDRCTPTRSMNTVGNAFRDSLELVRQNLR